MVPSHHDFSDDLVLQTKNEHFLLKNKKEKSIWKLWTHFGDVEYFAWGNNFLSTDTH